MARSLALRNLNQVDGLACHLWMQIIFVTMAGASFKFLRIFALYYTDSENWVSFLDDCSFMNIFFLVKVWDTVTVPRKPMLALSNLLSHDFIFSLFPVVDVIIDSGVDVAVEKRHCSCVCHSCCRIRGKRWIAVCYFENHRALKVTRYQQAKSMQSCLPLIFP